MEEHNCLYKEHCPYKKITSIVRWSVLIISWIGLVGYGLHKSEVKFNPYALIAQGVEKEDPNEFIAGNNTFLVVHTKHNKVYKFPMHAVHNWYAGSRYINIETKEHDLYIPLDQIISYKLINGK